MRVSGNLPKDCLHFEAIHVGHQTSRIATRHGDSLTFERKQQVGRTSPREASDLSKRSSALSIERSSSSRQTKACRRRTLLNPML